MPHVYQQIVLPALEVCQTALCLAIPSSLSLTGMNDNFTSLMSTIHSDPAQGLQLLQKHLLPQIFAMATAHNAGPEKFTFPLVISGGSNVLHLDVAVLQLQGSISQFVCSIQDVTRLRNLEAGQTLMVANVSEIASTKANTKVKDFIDETIFSWQTERCSQ